MSAVFQFVPRPVQEMRVQAVRDELVADMKRALVDDRAKVASYVVRGDGKLLETSIVANQAIKDALEHLTATGRLRDLLANNSGLPDAERIQNLRDSLVEGYAELNTHEIAQARGLLP